MTDYRNPTIVALVSIVLVLISLTLLAKQPKLPTTMLATNLSKAESKTQPITQPITQPKTLSLEFTVAQTPSDQGFKALLESSDEIQSVVNLVNDEFQLLNNITLVFGEDEGPLFDSELNKIIIPYAFLDEIQERFTLAKYEKTSGLKLDEIVIDAVMHTLFHELAHAFIAQYDLPVLGREEDAADGLASIFLIEYFEQGQEIVLTAADLFDLESQDIETLEKQDYWGEHSLDIQRYYSSMCNVYGSAPKAYAHIKKEQGFSAEKAENCITDYDILLHSWLTLLKPYRK